MLKNLHFYSKNRVFDSKNADLPHKKILGEAYVRTLYYIYTTVSGALIGDKTSMTTGKKRAANSKWNDDYVITAYEMARDGMTEQAMSKVLGISKITFTNWEKSYPQFRKALQRGRAYSKFGVKPYAETLDYIYDQLPDDLKVVWQKLHQFNLARAGIAKVEALLAGRGKLIRQKMFLCALVKCNFVVAAACRMTGLKRITVEKWKGDIEFQRLIKEVEQIEREWSESCLRRLVQQGDFGANKFHLQAIAKDKYGPPGSDTLNVNVSGQIEHKHQLVLMEDLDLPLNIQKMLLTAVRNQRKLVESTEVKGVGDVDSI